MALPAQPPLFRAKGVSCELPQHEGDLQSSQLLSLLHADNMRASQPLVARTVRYVCVMKDCVVYSVLIASEDRI